MTLLEVDVVDEVAENSKLLNVVNTSMRNDTVAQMEVSAMISIEWRREKVMHALLN